MIPYCLWILLPTVLSMQFMKDYKIPIEDNDKHVYCDGRDSNRSTPDAPVERLFVHACDPMAYGNLMENETSTTEPIELLELIDVPPYPPLNEAHFRGVTAKEIKITGSHPLRPNPNFVASLNMTTKLTVANTILPPLPESSLLETLWLHNGSSTGELGGCLKLLELRLINWTVEETPFYTNCSMLTVVGIESSSVKTVQHVVESADRVHMLTVRHCGLVTLPPNLLARASNLCYIDLSHNNLLYLHESTFARQRFLMHLDLSNNQLRSETVARALIRLPGVVDLYLGNNSLSDFCDHFDDFGRKIHPRLVDLTSAGLTRLCFSSWKFMKELVLVKNNITELTLTEFPLPNRMPSYDLSIDLSENPLQAPRDSRELFKALIKKFYEIEHTTIRVKMELEVDCDCQHGWLAKALNFLPNLELPDLLCNNHKNRTITSVPPEELECDKFSCEPCTCRRLWHNNGTVADCEGLKLRRVPHIPGARALLAAYNFIDTIDEDDFPSSLELIDLRGNNLERANESAAHALLAVGTERRVMFAGNPLACDCENSPLIEAFTNYTTKVEDYADIQCADSEYALTQISVFKLCGDPQRVWTLSVVVAGSALAAALLALTSALYCRYGRVIRVFLHARGLLCCARDDDFDGDWLYDAFVSFSHKDMQFVEEELLPRLESGPLQWRVCVHYRDWMAGELISTQIARSVAASRCTIVVLSRNLLASVWGMLEFRTAHASALHDGRARLVVIVLDDIVEDDQLNSEIRSYVRINTYVRWGDPWFWDKLFYALPHKRKSTIFDKKEKIITDKPYRF